MRACVVGGGLAGSLLAWRLARLTANWRIDLVLGENPGESSGENVGQRAPDATAVSGGAIRAYEPDPEQRELAVASLVELLTDATLRAWAGYRPLGAVYLRTAWPAAARELAEIDVRLPGWARLIPATDLTAFGFAGLPPGTVAVVERAAGCLAPDRLRRAVIVDLARYPAVHVHAGTLTGLAEDSGRSILCTVGGEARPYDVVVFATGASTPALLRRCGLPADGYRTKTIQYTVHAVDGWRPPTFVDTTTDLYGLPTADGGLLLGVPTQAWDLDPAGPPFDPALATEAARLAEARFPRLRLGPARRQVSAADCYYDPPVLTLRPVASGQPEKSTTTDSPTPDSSPAREGHRLFTFTGGSGGSAKTALAASRRAATQLASVHNTSTVAVSQ